METLRVLIAEEKNLIASRLAVQLEVLGHRVLGVVKDGETAGTSIWRSQPDLIILDQHLPPQGGIEAAREILTRHVIPLILLIGYPSAGLVKRAQEVGVLAYLVWPADAKALDAAIRVALIRFRELRILREQAEDLQQALRSRMVVERAKRVLVRRLELGEAHAFGYMQRQSRSNGIPLKEVAANLVTAEELWFGKPGLVEYVDIILDVLGRPGVLGPPRVA